MAYMENYAAKKGNIITEEDASPVSSGGSDQEKATSRTASKIHTVDTSSNPLYNTGNQVRTQANTKNTGRVGVTSTMAQAHKDWSKGAVENPDGQPNRGGEYDTKAAKS